MKSKLQKTDEDGSLNCLRREYGWGRGIGQNNNKFPKLRNTIKNVCRCSSIGMARLTEDIQSS